MATPVPVSMESVIMLVIVFASFIFTGIAIGAFFFIKLHKHLLIIREITDSNTPGVMRIIKCRISTDKEDQEYWIPRLGSKLGRQPAPPSEYRCVGTSGQWVAMGFISEGNVSWVKPDPKEKYYEDVPVMDTNGKPKLDENQKPVTERTFYHLLDIFSGTQKWAHMKALERAAKRRQGWKEMLFPLAGAGICLLALFILVIGYKDFTEKPLQMADKVQAMQTQNAVITEKQAEITRLLQDVIEERRTQPPRQVLPDEPPG